MPFGLLHVLTSLRVVSVIWCCFSWGCLTDECQQSEAALILCVNVFIVLMSTTGHDGLGSSG